MQMHLHKIFVTNLFMVEYDDKEKINEFVNKVDVITYEFENIPYETLHELNRLNLYHQSLLLIGLFNID